MLDFNESIDNIMRYTGLTKEDILSLQAQPSNAWDQRSYKDNGSNLIMLPFYCFYNLDTKSKF